MQSFIFNESNTFCISLESKKERWERIHNRFTQLGLSVTKWKASTRDDLKDKFGPYLNDGQKGCAQSHINIWKYMLQNNLDYVLILEDDACFDKLWIEKLNIFCEKNTDNDWHAIFLNASEPIEPTHLWVKAHEQYLTAGYILSRKGAQQLINDFGNCFFSSDWMTSRLQLHGHSYCYFPWLIIQEGKDSSIGQNLEADHAKVLRCLNNIDYSLENYI